MKRNFILLLIVAALAFAGCSKVEEPVKIDENQIEETQIEETTRADSAIDGYHTLFQNTEYLYTCPSGKYNQFLTWFNYTRIQWRIGKLDAAGNFVEVTKGVNVIPTPNIYEYKIKVNIPGGDYVIEAMAWLSFVEAVYRLPVKVFYI